jgi:hypothetical protein
VVLGGMLLPLGEEDGGAPRWSFEGGARWGLNSHQAKAFAQPLPVPATMSTPIGVDYLVEDVVVVILSSP